MVRGNNAVPVVSMNSIDRVTRETLGACGVSEKSVEVILDTIHYANRRDIPTHGIGRLPLYVKKIKAGHLNPRDEVMIILDEKAVALLDAKGCFGQVAAKKAIDIALDKAQKYGVAAVGVRKSNNFGTAGYYGDYVARRGMVALIFANAAPAIAPTGGNKTIFGTNPLCFAFPGSSTNYPIVLDMATTVAARGKIRLAAKNGDKIPMNWALGPDGEPTDDPNKALKGALLPIAGYKGYGLSLFVDVFAGMLTGAAYAGNVKPLSNLKEESNNGHFFIVIDVKRFMDTDDLNERINIFCDSVRSCGECGAVFIPGERGYEKMALQEDAVFISDSQFEEINEVAKSVGVSARLEKN